MSSPPPSTDTIDKEHPTPSSLPQMDTEETQSLADQTLEMFLPDLELFFPESTEQEAPSLPSSRPTYLRSPNHTGYSFFRAEGFASTPSADGSLSDISHDCPSSIEFNGHLPNINPISLSLSPKSSPLSMKFRFLAQFTAAHGLANSFECGNILARRKIMSTFGQNGKALSTVNLLAESPVYQRPAHARLWTGSDQVPGWHHPFLGASLLRDWSYPDQSGHLGNVGLIESHQRVYCHPLKSKSHEIVQGIRGVVCHDMRCRGRTINWNPPMESSCIRFFSPPNLDRFMEAFWHFWYPNWPVFHRPTFIATQKPAQLIAALSLIGACVSPEKTDRDQAMLWIEAVGDWIHHDPKFSEDAVPQTDDEVQRLQLELRLDMVRAAYAIILIMTWEGNEKQMTVARRTRFSQVICVARSLCFFPIAQKNVSGGPDPSNHFQSWMLFALREECIRTLIYVFLLDCAFVMFFNSAPRMAIIELQFSLAKPEACFNALTPEMWLNQLKEWSECQYTDHELTLFEAIRMILKDELQPEEWEMIQKTNLLNLFAITCGKPLQ
ncbi:zinc finger C2H2 type domain-containing protein [Fusarium pseudoanthophilum]|uniref:Zinc finger C2H2 type domain-containing protein n=1 Tax=Fusarium pseudoanthophilum TaxID=48495 RepID=A0A8H5NYR4_9HYPO|nr:zinc finger C2H2 type domain-containing protein [Fusarium pseudoanthophilum]